MLKTFSPFVLWCTAVFTSMVFSSISFAQESDAQDNKKDQQEESAKQVPEGTVSGQPAFTTVRQANRTPRDGTPLISNKLYPMQYRFEIAGFFDMNPVQKFVKHLGGHGAVAFHITDWLAIEGFGGYLIGDETNVVKQEVRSAGQSIKDYGADPQLPDLWQTTWFVGADIQWAPLYGKLSFVSEYDINFQLYGIGGLAAEGIRRAQWNGGTSLASYSTPQVRVSGMGGLGIRLIPVKWLALRVELRDFIGLNPDVLEHDPADQSKCDKGFVLPDGQGNTKCYQDFSNLPLVQFGISILI